MKHVKDMVAEANEMVDHMPAAAAMALHGADGVTFVDLRDPRELARSLRGMGTGRQPSLWERLSELRVSTCAVAGALDRKYVGIAGRMARVSRYVHAAVVEEAGHNMHAEQPRRFVTLLHAFLEQP